MKHVQRRRFVTCHLTVYVQCKLLTVLNMTYIYIYISLDFVTRHMTVCVKYFIKAQAAAQMS